MKTKLLNLMAITMIAFVCINFVSCGSDDEEPNVSGDISWLLNGTWTESVGIRKWTFYKNGTCKFEVDHQTFNPTTKKTESHWESQQGSWRYNDETKVLSTNLYSWNWVIVSHSENMWTGSKGGDLYTYSR